MVSTRQRNKTKLLATAGMAHVETHTLMTRRLAGAMAPAISLIATMKEGT